jgi:hypothetical protein
MIIFGSARSAGECGECGECCRNVCLIGGFAVTTLRQLGQCCGNSLGKMEIMFCYQWLRSAVIAQIVLRHTAAKPRLP